MLSSKPLVALDFKQSTTELIDQLKNICAAYGLGNDGNELRSSRRCLVIARLFSRQNEDNFAKLFDDTLRQIAIVNSDIFSVKTGGGAQVRLFDEISQFISDPGEPDNFCKAIINKLVNFSFEHIFTPGFDFFADIFEYLIKDYNKDSGGKYAEYYRRTRSLRSWRRFLCLRTVAAR